MRLLGVQWYRICQESPLKKSFVYLAISSLSCGTYAELLYSMGDLSSLKRDQTHIPCITKWSLNHWTTREFPKQSFHSEDQVLYLACPTIKEEAQNLWGLLGFEE